MGNESVSNQEDLLVLVDDQDQEVGVCDKLACHRGEGLLHRAVSVFLINKDQEILIQRRHADKLLWGGYWSNSCCTHPRPGETTARAANRRVYEELGLRIRMVFVYKFSYAAKFNDSLSEREVCSVFKGIARHDPTINTTEIAEWQWTKPAVLDNLMDRHEAKFTPWSKLEWQQFRKTLDY